MGKLIMKLLRKSVFVVFLFTCYTDAQRGRFNNRRHGRRPGFGFGVRPGNGFGASRPGRPNFGPQFQLSRPNTNSLGLNFPGQSSGFNRPNINGIGDFSFPSGGSFRPNNVNNNNNNNNQNNPCTDNNPATICITDIVTNNQPSNPCTDNNPFTICISGVSNNQPTDSCSDNNPATICITDTVPGPGVRSQNR